MNGNGICHAYFSSCRVSDEFFLKITKKGIFGQIFLCFFCQMPGPLGRAIFYRIAYPMGILAFHCWRHHAISVWHSFLSVAFRENL
jgi:hypothetical protein